MEDFHLNYACNKIANVFSNLVEPLDLWQIGLKAVMRITMPDSIIFKITYLKAVKPNILFYAEEFQVFQVVRLSKGT